MQTLYMFTDTHVKTLIVDYELVKMVCLICRKPFTSFPYLKSLIDNYKHVKINNLFKMPASLPYLCPSLDCLCNDFGLHQFVISLYLDNQIPKSIRRTYFG